MCNNETFTARKKMLKEVKIYSDSQKHIWLSVALSYVFNVSL